MNIEAYNLIIDTISKLLEAKNFKVTDTENGSYFANEATAVRVRYDEERELFYLEQSPLQDGAPSGDWKALSSWLFANNAPVKEAKSIANDFEDTLREILGVKPTTVKATSTLPAKGNAGDDPTPTTLAGRFLTIFPQYKGNYEQYVTEGGTFLYVHFFEEIAVPHLNALLDADDKKRLEKYFAMLNQTYCNGDKEARAVVSAVILAGSLRNQPDRMATAQKYMEEYPFLKTAAQFAVKVKK
jgi:hypothetical protein